MTTSKKRAMEMLKMLDLRISNTKKLSDAMNDYEHGVTTEQTDMRSTFDKLSDQNFMENQFREKVYKLFGNDTTQSEHFISKFSNANMSIEDFNIIYVKLSDMFKGKLVPYSTVYNNMIHLINNMKTTGNPQQQAPVSSNSRTQPSVRSKPTQFAVNPYYDSSDESGISSMSTKTLSSQSGRPTRKQLQQEFAALSDRSGSKAENKYSSSSQNAKRSASDYISDNSSGENMAKWDAVAATSTPTDDQIKRQALENVLEQQQDLYTRAIMDENRRKPLSSKKLITEANKRVLKDLEHAFGDTAAAKQIRTEVYKAHKTNKDKLMWYTFNLLDRVHSKEIKSEYGKMKKANIAMR